MPEVKLPELGEGIEKATVSYWHSSAGQEVKEGADLVELATDKATFNLPAPASGVLKEIKIQEGDDVTVGQVLAIIE